MNEQFIAKFLRVARHISRAERGLAVDAGLNIVDTINLSQDVLDSAGFVEVMTANLNRALTEGEPIITNNMISDPSQAPVTNTNFAELRVIVVIPVAALGAIYLEQPIRYGVIPRATVDRLMRLAGDLVANREEGCSEAEMVARYEQLT